MPMLMARATTLIDTMQDQPTHGLIPRPAGLAASLDAFEPAHGRDLAQDLQVMSRELLHRRRALGWLASAAGSALLLNACGGGGSSDTTSTASSTDTGSTTTTTTTSSGSTTTTDTSGSSVYSSAVLSH